MNAGNNLLFLETQKDMRVKGKKYLLQPGNANFVVHHSFNMGSYNDLFN